ncbi:MAG: UDP-N-acetylglucosamine 1-carboxyvinyltransferase [Angelakisella sp.]|nr:UDP-N-acetylglucosamine 1-carboxyvinyltransferase [Angelakisella sp.]MCI9528127.1 UDP-N-acetylglucosamine 1-carboxyvinyltransferase [Angelakisella sp.]
MSVYIIHGGNRVRGRVAVHGAKNSALPILAAAAVCGDSVIENCPRLTDISVAMEILGHLGCRARREGDAILTTQGGPGDCRIPDELMGAMRSSIVFLGGMVARHGCAELTLPGGCELGARPIDLHLFALSQMGADITEAGGRLYCSAPRGLHGARINLSFPSVGATENTIIAAATARGETVLTGAAREPEILDLIDFLRGCGASIDMALDGTIRVEGVERLHGVRHRVIPDRIAAGTYLCAAAMTGGELLAQDVVPGHISSCLSLLEGAGCRVETGPDWVRLTAPERLEAFGTVKTMPYPGFPTDMQSVMMAAATVARGTTLFVENIFESRYRHVPELRKLGASIVTEGRAAVVTGVERLTGASLVSTDLRGGAAVVLGALAAEGESVVAGLDHIDRGYDDLEGNLRRLGADIKRDG